MGHGHGGGHGGPELGGFLGLVLCIYILVVFVRACLEVLFFAH